MAEVKQPYCPDPNVAYFCPYCNTTARLVDEAVVVDCYRNVCHYHCLTKARRTGRLPGTAAVCDGETVGQPSVGGPPLVPDGFWCQNCQRVPVGVYNDICEGCLAAGAARRAKKTTIKAPASIYEGVCQTLNALDRIESLLTSAQAPGRIKRVEDIPTIAETLETLTPASSRCGHNFQIPKCPYKHCAARELYEALQPFATMGRQFVEIMANGGGKLKIPSGMICDWSVAAIKVLAKAEGNFPDGT